MRVASIPLLDGHGMCLIVTGVHDGAEDEAVATVHAIKRGEIDAVVVAENEDDPQVLLLGAAGRRYRALVEHMRDGAMTLSTDGDVLYANPRFAAMVGLVPGDVVGMRLAGLRATSRVDRCSTRSATVAAAPLRKPTSR